MTLFFESVIPLVFLCGILAIALPTGLVKGGMRFPIIDFGNDDVLCGVKDDDDSVVARLEAWPLVENPPYN